MLPYSYRKDYISFTDKKWNLIYKLDENGLANIENPIFNELMPSGQINTHLCRSVEKDANF